MTDASTNRTITIECLRFDPEAGDAPTLQRWDVPYTDDMSVLQGLQYIKDHLDGSLSFRWSCRMAICGSCGMMLDGVPTLACSAFLRDYHPGPLRVEPLAHFQVLRDLVIDQGGFLDKLEAVEPWLHPAEPRPLEAGPSVQTPAQMQAYYRYSQCINCLLCCAACPQYGLDENFLGPAPLALLARWNLDARDVGWPARRAAANSDAGVWGCTLVGHCSEVCPKDVDPARAINQNKAVSAADWLGLARWVAPHRGQR
jgi:fumarate reductase iron-sulfur subunit